MKRLKLWIRTLLVALGLIAAGTSQQAGAKEELKADHLSSGAADDVWN